MSPPRGRDHVDTEQRAMLSLGNCWFGEDAGPLADFATTRGTDRGTQKWSDPSNRFFSSFVSGGFPQLFEIRSGGSIGPQPAQSQARALGIRAQLEGHFTC